MISNEKLKGATKLQSKINLTQFFRSEKSSDATERRNITECIEYLEREPKISEIVGLFIE
jgi:hypothetical protein